MTRPTGPLGTCLTLVFLMAAIVSGAVLGTVCISFLFFEMILVHFLLYGGGALGALLVFAGLFSWLLGTRESSREPMSKPIP